MAEVGADLVGDIAELLAVHIFEQCVRLARDLAHVIDISVG